MKKVLIILAGVVLLIGGLWWIKSNYKEAEKIFEKLPLINDKREISEQENDFCQNECSPISGLQCANYNRRPIMVMLGEDEEARPLSGLSGADMIIEMPVVTGGINRLAAIYLCNLPEEIGSVRSARDDFIPLAKGYDAVLVHWGGSHFALDELVIGVIDNIDALPNSFNAFYRKKGIYAPHNGFTSGDRLLNSMQKLGYRLENNFPEYPHLKSDEQDLEQYGKNSIIKVNYPSIFEVSYQYDEKKKGYLRKRNGKVEKDLVTNEDIYAKVIVIMEADSRQIEGQYNDVEVIGMGDLQVFQGGVMIEGKWEKKSYDDKLYFIDKNKEEIKFLAGQIWIQIIEPEVNIY